MLVTLLATLLMASPDAKPDVPLSAARQLLRAKGVPVPPLEALADTDIVCATTDPNWPFTPEGEQITLTCGGDIVKVKADLVRIFRGKRDWKLRLRSGRGLGLPEFESTQAWFCLADSLETRKAPFLFKDAFRGDPKRWESDYKLMLREGQFRPSRATAVLFQLLIVVKPARSVRRV